MKRFGLVIIVVLVASSMCLAAPERLRLEKAGFSIEPLDAEPVATPYQAAILFLPPSGNFAPNVNVQVQPYTGTIDEYLKLSEQQIFTMKMNLISKEQPDKSSMLVEYAGEMQGYKMHFYAKAIANGTNIFLATGTCTESQWENAVEQIKRCVQSLQSNDAEKPAAAQ